MTRWTTRTALSLLCLAVLTRNAVAEDPCKRNKDGSITCTEQGMKTLTDGVIDLRAKVKTIEAKNEALAADKADAKRLLKVCQDSLMSIPPPPDALRVMSGYTVGLVSMGLMTTGFLLDLPMDIRASLLGVGMLGVAAGGVMVMP